MATSRMTNVATVVHDAILCLHDRVTMEPSGRRVKEASFHSAKAAQTYFIDCAPTREAEPSMAGARVAELRLGLGASFDPASLSPSENDATLALRSQAERTELSELPAPARKARKSASI